MGFTELPSEDVIRQLHDQGLLLCCCMQPIYEWLGPWNCYQCRRCGKPIR